jgi:hypothetical protein
MSVSRRHTSIILLAALGCLGRPAPAATQTSTLVPAGGARPAAVQAAAPRDGSHDFDFTLGTWHTHIRRLQHPLSGSSTWYEVDGTVTIRPIWGGKGDDIEELELDGPKGHLEGLTLRLYDPQARQWNLSWSNASDGTIGQPLIGEFDAKDGRGEFVAQDTDNGRTILVRQVYSEITATTHHFEQAFSDDYGKTWEPNWVATLTRADGPGAPPPAGAPAPATAAGGSINHDFDFNLGRWRTHVSRRLHPLAGSDVWAEYDGTSVVDAVWHGRASLIKLDVAGPAGRLQGMGLRLYNPAAKQWGLNWVSGGGGTLSGQPMVGEFRGGRGDFVDREAWNGRTIYVRNSFSDITPHGSHFEQAFSADGGKTWETNWIMTFAAAEPRR